MPAAASRPRLSRTWLDDAPTAPTSWLTVSPVSDALSALTMSASCTCHSCRGFRHAIFRRWWGSRGGRVVMGFATDVTAPVSRETRRPGGRVALLRRVSTAQPRPTRAPTRTRPDQDVACRGGSARSRRIGNNCHQASSPADPPRPERVMGYGYGQQMHGWGWRVARHARRACAVRRRGDRSRVADRGPAAASRGRSRVRPGGGPRADPRRAPRARRDRSRRIPPLRLAALREQAPRS
jgi:hypothetical protein